MPFKGVDKTLHVILFVVLYMLAHCGAQPLRYFTRLIARLGVIFN